jgi:hypothetical protein
MGIGYNHYLDGKIILIELDLSRMMQFGENQTVISFHKITIIGSAPVKLDSIGTNGNLAKYEQ